MGEPIVAFEDERQRMNDGGCDPQGRFHCGSMAYDETPGVGTLWRLDADLTVHAPLTGSRSRTGCSGRRTAARRLHVDTPTNRIDAYDFDGATGAFTNRRRS